MCDFSAMQGFADVGDEDVGTQVPVCREQSFRTAVVDLHPSKNANMTPAPSNSSSYSQALDLRSFDQVVPGLRLRMIGQLQGQACDETVYL